MNAVLVTEAAKEMNVSPKTVRQWIRDGAPCAQPGGSGPGNGARVYVADLKQWRARRAGIEGDSRVLDKIADALLDTQMRDGGTGRPVHVNLGIPARASAIHLLAAYWRIHRAITGESPKELPPAVEKLVKIANANVRIR